MVILWWQDVVLGYSYFVPANMAAINTWGLSGFTWFYQFVECFIVTFSDELCVLVECHWQLSF